MNIQFTEEFSNFSFSTLNCNGFKSTIDYIDYLSRYDINFVCETWLIAGNICNIKEYFSHKWCQFFTSMDPTEIGNGHPFGGIGFICNERKNVHYNIMETLSDRICDLQVYVNNVVVFLSLVYHCTKYCLYVYL